MYLHIHRSLLESAFSCHAMALSKSRLAQKAAHRGWGSGWSLSVHSLVGTRCCGHTHSEGSAHMLLDISVWSEDMPVFATCMP